MHSVTNEHLLTLIYSEIGNINIHNKRFILSFKEFDFSIEKHTDYRVGINRIGDSRDCFSLGIIDPLISLSDSVILDTIHSSDDRYKLANQLYDKCLDFIRKNHDQIKARNLTHFNSFMDNLEQVNKQNDVENMKKLRKLSEQK